MKPLLVIAGILAVALGSYAQTGTRVHAAFSVSAPMSIHIVEPDHPVTVPVNGTIHLKVKVSGLVMDPKDMGKKNIPGHGHFHIYVDCLPGEGYSQVAMSRCFAAASGTTSTDLNLSRSQTKIGYGTHTLMLALAQNDHILYRVPPAVMLFTVARSKMGIQLLSPSQPVTISPHGKIPLHVKVNGMTLAPHAIGRKFVAGEGHYHLYIDCVPPNAYKQANMSRCFADALGTSTGNFDLGKSQVKVSPGTHLLLLALARNDHILYQVPTASLVFTVR